MISDDGWRIVAAGERLSNRPPAVAVMGVHVSCQTGLDEGRSPASVDVITAKTLQAAKNWNAHQGHAVEFRDSIVVGITNSSPTLLALQQPFPPLSRFTAIVNISHPNRISSRSVPLSPDAPIPTLRSRSRVRTLGLRCQILPDCGRNSVRWRLRDAGPTHIPG
jgi:hypothetical protein